MKARTRLITIVVGLVVILFIVWQGTSHWSLFTGERYPGFVNAEELEIPEGIRLQWEAQLQLALALLEQDPEDLSQLEDTAALEHRLGLYADAREHMEALLERNQINPISWVIYGDIALDMGDYDTAEQAYIKSLELQINSTVVSKLDRLWRAQFPERVADIGGLYEQAIAIDGQSPGYLIPLALWYEEQGDYESAISHMEVAYTMEPDRPGLKEAFDDLRERAREAKMGE